jgi:hypothetical protein
MILDLENLDLTSDDEFWLRLHTTVLDCEIEDEANGAATEINSQKTIEQIASLVTSIIVRNVRDEVRKRVKRRPVVPTAPLTTTAPTKPENSKNEEIIEAATNDLGPALTKRASSDDYAVVQDG